MRYTTTPAQNYLEHLRVWHNQQNNITEPNNPHPHPHTHITRQDLALASRTYYIAYKRQIQRAPRRTHASNQVLRMLMCLERYKHNRAANLYATQEADDIAYARIVRLRKSLHNQRQIAREQQLETWYERKQHTRVLAQHPITHLTHRVPYTTALEWKEAHYNHDCP
jgi:hypothetical protein